MGNETSFIIRLLRIEMKQFKNIEYGAITFPSYGYAKRHGIGKGQDVIGIYGQNGSGKTALVEALIVWQLLQQNMSVKEEYSTLIKKDAQIQLLFQLSDKDKVYQVKHGYVQSEDTDDMKQTMSYRIWEEGRWSR